MNLDANCPSCHSSFPAAATFCPFCGVSAEPVPVPFNRTLVGELLREPTGNETQAMMPVEDFRVGRAHGLKLFVGVAASAAVVMGVFIGSWLAEAVNRPTTVPPEATAAAEVAPAPAQPTMPRIDVSPTADGRGFDITRGAEIIHTVATAEGSRYETVDERMRSVAVRFKHVATKGAGRFAARPAGDHYELVWADEGGDFRLMDVTPRDAELAKSSPDLVAEYLADRLNAELPRPSNT